jgi:hypothetical protein
LGEGSDAVISGSKDRIERAHKLQIAARVMLT